MRADFRVKCEVEVRGLTALFLYAAYRRRAVSPVPRRRHLRKAPGNIAESAVLPYPLFPCGGKASRYSSRAPKIHSSPSPSCGKRGEKSRLRTNKTRGQRGGSETLTYVCYDRNLWELNEKKDASAA